MNKKAKICMNAMVGNEQATIMRMLQSVAPHIDYWSCSVMEQMIRKTLLRIFFQN